jgi:BlaI family penicillinase repressor
MKLSDAEWQLMNALWTEHPATAREIMERVDGDVKWAYTTVKTMLTRLVAKNAIAEEKKGNISFYSPLITQENARRGALKMLVDRVLGGTVEPIMHYLVEEQKLSQKERQELIRLLAQQDQAGEEGKDDSAE